VISHCGFDLHFLSSVTSGILLAKFLQPLYQGLILQFEIFSDPAFISCMIFFMLTGVLSFEHKICGFLVP